MRRIFVTTAFDFIRDTHFEMQNPDLTEYQDTIADGAISVIDKLSADEIVKCINELPEGCRLVFNLHAVEGYSHVEIARMLHINEGTSRSQFLHARKLLQAKLEKLN
jgi:RNA polymerase sigma-70 factor (ECF subfamily)